MVIITINHPLHFENKIKTINFTQKSKREVGLLKNYTVAVETITYFFNHLYSLKNRCLINPVLLHSRFYHFSKKISCLDLLQFLQCLVFPEVMIKGRGMYCGWFSVNIPNVVNVKSGDQS